LTKSAKKSPRVIAEEIIQHLQFDSSLITEVEIAGPGFINIRFGTLLYSKLLENISSAGDNYGKSSVGNGKKVNIEYVSANPTGELHLGHGRNACIGDVVANLYHWSGYDVTREYYFNNAGNQMTLLGLSVHARYCQIFDSSYPFPENGYKGEYISDIAQQLSEAHGNSLLEPTDTHIDVCKSIAEKWCTDSIQKTMATLNIVHDVYFNEQSLYEDGSIDKTIHDLREKDLVYENEGALWIALSKVQEKLTDRVIVKSTGEPTYRLPDIAYHRNKFERGYDAIVDVFGADHLATVPDIIASIKSLGYDEQKIHVLLYQFVTLMENGEQVKMSKRSGKSYTLNELIDDVGADVVRFFFIMRSINTHLEFDLALAKEQSEKNPVLYVQYAHARICRIMETAKEREIPLTINNNYSLLVKDEEKNLIKTLARFEEHIRRALTSHEPYIVTEYLRELASDFHAFYHHCPVLRTEGELRDSRIALCKYVQSVLRNGLHILGVSAPNAM
jgi:arginyl-tRNA synthetase